MFQIVKQEAKNLHVRTALTLSDAKKIATQLKCRVMTRSDINPKTVGVVSKKGDCVYFFPIKFKGITLEAMDETIVLGKDARESDFEVTIQEYLGFAIDGNFAAIGFNGKLLQVA